MYPTIQSFDHSGGAQCQPLSGAQPHPRTSEYATRPSSVSNGPTNPPTPSTSSNSSSFPTLRVQLAEPYRTAPPVRLAITPLPPTRPARSLVLDFEHKDAREDPYEVLLKRYTDMGYTREVVAMALVIAGDDTDKADKVVECCKQYKELRDMGFKADIVVGALVMSKGDITAATEACLTANMEV